MAERPRALLQSRPGGGSFEIEGEAIIGRASRHPVVIEDGRVSSDHARIAWDEAAGCFVLEDLGSTNGTELDGIRVRSPEPLGRLHTISFAGVHHFVFRDLSAPALDTAPVAPLGAHGSGEKTAIGAIPVLPPAGLGKDGGSDDLPGETTDAHGAPLAVPASLFARSDADGAEDGAPQAPSDPLQDSAVHDGTLAGDERALALPPALAERADALLDGGLDAATAAVRESVASGESPSSPFAEIDPAARVADLEAGGGGEPESRYALEVVFEDGRIERFPLRPGSNLIGRGRDADVRVESPHLSRRHASVRVAAGAIAVRDLGSSNHTFVAGHRIETEVEIEAGDTLRLGNLAVRVVAESDQEGSDR